MNKSNDIKIIFEDQDILVLEKPAGMVVNKSDTQKEITVQDWVVEYLKVEGLGIGDRGGIVHRLDKETSGVLLVAKNQNSFDNLQDQFQNRTVSKQYIALVHGKLESDNGIIKEKIARNPFNRMRFGVFPEGRDAETHYQVIAYANDYSKKAKSPTLRSEMSDTNSLAKGETRRNKSHERKLMEVYTLVEVTPKTGRTHQIRVHFKHINHPVVGDELYAGRKTSKADRLWCPRQFLHASYLKVHHPRTNLEKIFRSELPPDLQNVWDNLRKD